MTTPDTTPTINYDPLDEIVAAQVHEMWSSWMGYMFGKCIINDDGTATIPADKVSRWTRQLNTPYEELPRFEKHSDISIAIRYITLIEGALNHGPSTRS